MKKSAFHPLIDEQPVDTLSHIQTMLRFAQESTIKANVDTELTPRQARIYGQLSGVLRMIGEALEYEIERLEGYRPPEEWRLVNKEKEKLADYESTLEKLKEEMEKIQVI